MKNGNRIFFIVNLLAIGYTLGQNRSKKMSEEHRKNPTLHQYLNRFKEFFNEDKLESIELEFFSLIDFGMSQEMAFEAITFSGELN